MKEENINPRLQHQQSPHFPDAFYRVVVKGLLVRDGKVMMTHDFTGPDKTKGEWELPGGGLDFGEDFHTTLKREVEEEMGLKVAWIEEKPKYIWPVKRGARRGMEWFYVLALIYRFELESLDFTPTDSCKEIKFFSKEELAANKEGMANQIHPLIDLFNPEEFQNK